MVHSSSRGVCAAKPHPFFWECYASAFVAEVESFLASGTQVRNPASSPARSQVVSGIDARKAVAVAREAAARHRG